MQLRTRTDWGALEYSMHPSGKRIAYVRSTGLVAQEGAIDNFLQFIQSGKSVVVPKQP